MLLTDAPGQDWDQALATITSIELMGEKGTQTIFSGSQTADLLSLPDFYDVFAVADNIIPDTFTKIRLHVERLELIELNDDGSVAQRMSVQLVGGGKIDLKPQGSFYAGPGDSLFIEIDFDMHKSFKTTTTGNGKTIVRPVIRVKVTRTEPVGRLTRLRGFIGEIDVDAQQLSLCQSKLVAAMGIRVDDDKEWEDDDRYHEDRHGDPGCIVVATDELTGLFGADGMPIAFDALLPGDALTAVGHLRRSYDDYAKLSAAYADGNSDSDDDSDDGTYDDDKGDDHHGSYKLHKQLALHAVTIELGDAYRRVAGLADSIVMGDTFDLALASGQHLGTDQRVLPTRLFERTRVFSVDGTELDPTAIEPGVAVLADGVLIISETDSDILRAALLILNLEAGDDEHVLRGEIVSVDFDAGILQLLVEDTERCVNADGADIFLISNSDGFSSARVGLGDLEPMQTVDIFGSAEDDQNCFIATDILASATVGNTLPLADAGEDRTVTAGQSVMLDGSGSSDEDGDSLTYSWVLVGRPEDSMAELSAADTAMPSFTADRVGEYVVELVVNDGTEDSAPDSVMVTANEAP